MKKGKSLWLCVVLSVLMLIIPSAYANESNVSLAQKYEGMAKDIEQRIEEIADNSSANEKKVEESTVGPLYEPHDCHNGTDHRNCLIESYPESCGCEIGYIRCCCGKKMGVYQDWCSKHGY